MTTQLQAQTRQLITANDQLDDRRVFTEAVLAGVTAGILSVDGDGRIQLANRSAEVLLAAEEGALVGPPLADAAPEMPKIIDAGQAALIVQIDRGLETQPTDVQLVEVAAGQFPTVNHIAPPPSANTHP